jgi:hypothetical protein
MFIPTQAADPRIHKAACAIATRIVNSFQPLLRSPEERDTALREKGWNRITKWLRRVMRNQPWQGTL